MASDVKHPTWLPRILRVPPRALRQARAFTRRTLGDTLDRALRVPGWLHPDQAALLCYGAHRCPDGLIVEIGSFKGRSTVFIAKGMKPTNRLHAVDPHLGGTIGSRADVAAAKRLGTDNEFKPDSWSVFNDTLDTWEIKDSVHIIRGYSHDARADWSEPIAMLWVDGDHRYDAVRQDIDDWVPLTCPGALMAFHDTHPNYGSDPGRSVRAAILDSGMLSSGQFETFLELRNLWMMRRVSSMPAARTH